MSNIIGWFQKYPNIPLSGIGDRMQGNVIGRRGQMKVVSYGRIGSDDASVEKTLALAIRYALEDAGSDVVLDIVNDIRRNYTTPIAQIEAAFKYVVAHVPYRHDKPDVIRELLGRYDETTGSEIVTRPRFTLSQMMNGEDCDGQATALASILTALGFPNFLKVIAWKTEKEDIEAGNPFTHVFNYVGIPTLNIAFPLDVVMEYEGWNNEKKPTIREKIYWVWGG